MKNALRPALALAALICLSAPSGRAAGDDATPRVYTHWESFHKEDGLPGDKVFCVAVDGDRVWAGTDNGLGLYEDGKWRSYGVKDGLSYPVVLSLALDPASGDLWAGTMKGLSRYSAGRWEAFTQLNSGLPNDVVFGVAVENQNVWVATTAGTGRFRVRDKKWDVWTPANSPQHEPWGYFVTYADGRVYAALWGGGVLEFDVAKEQWRSWLDPDGEMEYDVFRDDGLIHVITTSVSYVDKILWVSTYFGMSRYDGRNWRGYLDSDSGLASNFINMVKAKGPVAYACTDKGLSSVNGAFQPLGDLRAFRPCLETRQRRADGPGRGNDGLGGTDLRRREAPGNGQARTRSREQPYQWCRFPGRGHLGRYFQGRQPRNLEGG